MVSRRLSDLFRLGRSAALLSAAVVLAGGAEAQETLTRRERTTLQPLSSDASQLFGESVASDSNRAAFGAPGAFTSAGRVTIFERGSSNAWSLTTTLIASDAAAQDYFGDSVALEGDLVVVGAPGATGPLSTSQGAVFVFRKIGTAWVEVARLTASDGDDNDLFGASVALKGDTIVVGAPSADVGGAADRGAAYVFRNTSGNTWTEQTKLVASNGTANNNFGWSVATYQSPTLGRQVLVGAPGRNSNAGSAYLYRLTSNTWNQVSNLVPFQAGAIRFGESVGLSHFLSTDMAFVGSPSATSGGIACGVVSAHLRSVINGSDIWNASFQLAPSDGSNGDQFGASLAVHDDRFVAGAPGDTVRGVALAGSATMFRYASGIGWTSGAKIAAATGIASGEFGYAVALAGERVMVGAPFAASPAALRGLGYHFKLEYQQSSIDDNGRDDVIWFNPAQGGLAGWSMDDSVRNVSGSATYPSLVSSAYEYCGTGDLYGDGRGCAIFREKSTGIFRARRIDGTTATANIAISGGVSADWRYVATADISGDGKADIVLFNALTNQVNAWIMDGATKIDGGLVGVASGLEFLGAGDLDGDGRADLLWRDQTGVVRAWLLNGRTIVSSNAISGVGAVVPSWRVVAMADLDGDGDRDIVWRNLTTGGVSGWRMQGLVRQQGVVMASSIPLSWRVESAPDLDGDGTDDLLWRNLANGDVSRWRMVDFVKVSGAFIRNVAFSWSCLSDDDYNDDRGWDGNGDDDNWDDSNGDDWNDDHGGDDSDDNSGGNETVDGSAFVNSINTALVASSLPILEVEAELEGGVSYVQVYQWIAATQQLKLVVVRVSSQTVVYTTTWTPTADDLDRYGDAIDVLGDVTVAAITAVNQALAANPGAQPHAVELSSEDLGPVWDVELLLANGTFVTVVVNAN